MKYIIAFLLPLVLLAQTENWIYTYNGNLNHIDVAEALTCGLDGNIYVVGRTANYGTSSDCIVVSLNNEGGANWIYMDNPVNLEDIPFAVEYGLDHNIYVAGMSSAPVTYSNFMVLSLTTGGDTNWTYRHDGPYTIEDYDMAFTITYGSDGNIYAGGYSKLDSAGGEFFVVSLKPSGETNWTYRYGSIAFLGGAANSIVYGDDGNVYVAGHSFHVGTRRDFVVLSLSADGDTNWTYRYDGAFNKDEAASVVYGMDGNIYAVGYSTWIDSARYFTVISLTDEGDENWVFRYPGGTPELIKAEHAIVYGTDNNIYAAGRCSLTGQSDDFFVVSLSTAGDTNWTYRLNGSANDDDYAMTLVYGSDGNIYAAGRVNNTGSERDLTVVSLDPDGFDNWIYYYSAEGSYPFLDEAYAIDYGPDGHVYTSGCGYTSQNSYDFTVIGIDPETGVDEVQVDHAQIVRLDAMPNPFSKLTNIRYSILDTGYLIKNMTLSIYDVGGRLVRSFHQESSIENQESVVSWHGTDAAGKQVPAGVYFAELEGDDWRASEKLLLIR
jgi:uncharacterized delta-60 repeat protein